MYSLVYLGEPHFSAYRHTYIWMVPRAFNNRLTDDAVGRADGVPHAADERDPQKVLHGLPSHLEPLRL